MYLAGTLWAFVAFATAQEIRVPAASLHFGNQFEHAVVEAHNIDVICAVGINESNRSKFDNFMVVQDVDSKTDMKLGLVTGNLTATVYIGPTDAVPKRKLWSIQTEGTTGEITDWFYHVTIPGYQDIKTIQKYYNLFTGDLVYQGNSKLVSVYNWQAGRARFFMFVESVQNGLSLDGGGTIIYGDDSRILRKIAISGSQNSGIGEFVSLGLDSVEPSKEMPLGPPLRYQIRLKLQGLELIVPCDQDGPLLKGVEAIGNSKLPDGVAFKEE